LWPQCIGNDVVDEPRTRQVVDGIARSARAGAHGVLKQFFRLVRLYQAERTAVVASATPLDPAVRAELERGLAGIYGRTVQTTFVVDPALIGGVRLQIGSDVYDGSIRAGLAALESRF